MSKIIKLNRGYETIVDDEDYEKFSKWKWCVNVHKFNGRTRMDVVTSKKIPYGTLLTRWIMQPPSLEYVVDHINHNTLDNRKCNLRLCTKKENRMNCFSVIGSTSKYLGVHWDNSRSKWRSIINVNKKSIHLGRFDSEIDAAIAYDTEAKKYFGDFANLNFKH